MTYSPAPGDEDQNSADVILSSGPDTYFCDPPASMPESRPVRGFGIYAGRHVKRTRGGAA